MKVINIVYLCVSIGINLYLVIGIDIDHPLHHRQSDGKVYLYDLVSDPLENENIVNQEKYSDILSYFNNRHKYWISQVYDNPGPDETYRQSTWKANGGTSPWITSDYKPVNIEKKYNHKGAPNIVFVLVDDWGYNDVGFRSTYLSWTTPTFDKLASDGILLDNYYTYEICAPSRAALLTGRYSLRYGISYLGPELPYDEITIAQELKSAGYRNYIVGKWHVGFSTYQHFPTNRGFDYFYGFLSGEEDYFTKYQFEYDHENYFDLYENLKFVTNPSEISKNVHSGYLYQQKVENIIENHRKNYPKVPMFLYYSMQLIHLPWTAPEIFLRRCALPPTMSDIYDPTVYKNLQNYCGLNLMMDEAIANLTCTLNKYGFSENTILIISGDNGGTPALYGNSYPFRGNKGSLYRGGVSNTAIIHGSMIPRSRKGTVYSGQVHITDWLPTLMSPATDGKWTGSYTGQTIDGVDMWDAIMKNTESPHKEMVFYVANDSATIQYNMMKYMYGMPPQAVNDVRYVWDHDLDPKASHKSCDIAQMANPNSLSNTIRQSSYNILSLMKLSFDVILVMAIIVLLIIGIYRLNQNDRQFMMIKLIHEVECDDYRYHHDDDNDENENDEQSLPLTYQENEVELGRNGKVQS